MLPRYATILVLILSFSLSSCSQNPQVTQELSVQKEEIKHKPHPDDPYETFNRSTYKLNKVVDTIIYKPVAYLYIAYLPETFQIGIGNFFDNFREITNIANDLLQFKIAYMMHDTSRFLINTTIGLLGFFDPASSLGLEKRKEDFGQTLYHWGYKNSAYFIIPLLGPSTFRDSFGLTVDYFALSAWPWIESDWKYLLLTIDFIDLRARLLRKETVLNVLAVDEYTFMRDTYLQHRKFLFNDENKEDAETDESQSDIDSLFEENKTAKKVSTAKKESVSETTEIIKEENTDKKISD